MDEPETYGIQSLNYKYLQKSPPISSHLTLQTVDKIVILRTSGHKPVCPEITHSLMQAHNYTLFACGKIYYFYLVIIKVQTAIEKNPFNNTL